MKRKKIAAGNWKMNLSLFEAQALSSEIANMFRDEFRGEAELILAPSFPYLGTVASLVRGIQGISVAAQNIHTEEKGAYTGEVSAAMIASVGCTHCLVGHSERRQYFGETDATVLAKCRILLKHSLIPVLCLGETLEERESGKTFDIIRRQLSQGFFPLDANEARKLILAYEPVWAIGTGKTASPEQAQEVHAFIRKEISNHFGAEVASVIPVLYGGSVNAANAQQLFACADIDGGLVGGASLKSREFIQIAKSFS